MVPAMYSAVRHLLYLRVCVLQSWKNQLAGRKKMEKRIKNSLRCSMQKKCENTRKFLPKKGSRGFPLFYKTFQNSANLSLNALHFIFCYTAFLSYKQSVVQSSGSRQEIEIRNAKPRLLIRIRQKKLYRSMQIRRSLEKLAQSPSPCLQPRPGPRPWSTTLRRTGKPVPVPYVPFKIWKNR